MRDLLLVFLGALFPIILSWFLPATWNPLTRLRPLLARIRQIPGSFRQRSRVRLLRAGKYLDIQTLNFQELDALDSIPVDRLHPRVRAEMEEANRAAVAAAGAYGVALPRVDVLPRPKR